MSNQDKLKVLVVHPSKPPMVVEIDHNLKAMQEIVGGLIEEIMPFREEVAIICNEEGKLKNLPLNRALYTENAKLLDIISGSFFICYAPFESEKFQSLSDVQIKRYSEMFKTPEKFIKTSDGIKVSKIKDNER